MSYALDVIEWIADSTRNLSHPVYIAKVKWPDNYPLSDKHVLDQHMEFRTRIDHRTKIAEVIMVTAIMKHANIPRDQKWLIVKGIPFQYSGGIQCKNIP